MKGSRAIFTFTCVWFSSISGAEVEMRVRPGDDVTLYCDCVMPDGLYIAWFRNCSHQHQPPLVITYSEIFKNKFQHFSFLKNSSSESYDLLVKNVSENDLGLYHCAVHRIKGASSIGTVYHHGSLTTRLTLRDTVSPGLMASTVPTSILPGSDCSVCWKLLATVCPVCILLSLVLSSTCVYCIFRIRTKDLVSDQRGGVKVTKQDEVGGGDEVCYTSLDLPSRGQKRLKKKKRVESSDFSTYSEVKISHF